MSREKIHYETFKRKMRIAKSLLDGVQSIIPLRDMQSAKRLTLAAQFLIPTAYEVQQARKEAPIRMALRGETRTKSRSASYRKITEELGAEINELIRQSLFSRRRGSTGRNPA